MYFLRGVLLIAKWELTYVVMLKGENIVRSSCGCGICAAVCPRGILKLENDTRQAESIRTKFY
jgi:ferredoxin